MINRVKKMYSNIKALREDHDLNQSELANLLGITQTTYSRYETGKLDIPSQALIQLSKYFHVSVDYLLGLKNEP